MSFQLKYPVLPEHHLFRRFLARATPWAEPDDISYEAPNIFVLQYHQPMATRTSHERCTFMWNKVKEFPVVSGATAISFHQGGASGSGRSSMKITLSKPAPVLPALPAPSFEEGVPDFRSPVQRHLALMPATDEEEEMIASCCARITVVARETEVEDTIEGVTQMPTY